MRPNQTDLIVGDLPVQMFEDRSQSCHANRLDCRCDLLVGGVRDRGPDAGQRLVRNELFQVPQPLGKLMTVATR